MLTMTIEERMYGWKDIVTGKISQTVYSLSKRDLFDSSAPLAKGCVAVEVQMIDGKLIEKKK